MKAFYFLLLPVIFSVFLSSCGQVCIMGQGECPGYNTETQLTLTASSTLVTQDPTTNVTVSLQINGGTAKYDLTATSTTSALVNFENTGFSGSTVSKDQTSSTTHTIYINKEEEITQQETITVTVTDADGKTASVSIKVNPASSF